MTSISDEAGAALAADPAMRESLAQLPEPRTGAPALPAESLADAAVAGLDPAAFMNYQGDSINTCGQAAIASILSFYNVNLGNMGPAPWPNDLAVDQVVADGFKPDVVFGCGTSGGTIALALQHYGLTSVSCGYVGVGGIACQGGWSWQQCWQTLQQWVKAGYPVPAMVSAPTVGLGSTPVEGHWPVVLRIDGDTVTLGNCRGYGRGENYLLRIPVARFLDGWNYLAGAVCGYSHCFVVANGRR